MSSIHVTRVSSAMMTTMKCSCWPPSRSNNCNATNIWNRWPRSSWKSKPNGEDRRLPEPRRNWYFTLSFLTRLRLIVSRFAPDCNWHQQKHLFICFFFLFRLLHRLFPFLLWRRWFREHQSIGVNHLWPCPMRLISFSCFAHSHAARIFFGDNFSLFLLLSTDKEKKKCADHRS